MLERFSQERQVRETSEFYLEALGRKAVSCFQRRGAAGGGELNEVANSKPGSQLPQLNFLPQRMAPRPSSASATPCGAGVFRASARG